MRVCQLLLLLVTVTVSGQPPQNLSCYQCTRASYESCPPEDLLPCPDNKDRCVTHIAKDELGLRVRRECGLGMCGFSDSAMSRGLGFDALCDRSRDSFSCLFCCKTSGCNKDAAPSAASARPVVVVLLLVLVPALS